MLLRSFIYADYLVTALHHQQPHTTTNMLNVRKQINNRTRLLATLSSLPFHQTHIDKLELLKMEYYIMARLTTRWWKRLGTMDRIHKGQKKCTGRGERVCGQHSLFHWVLMRLHMIRDTERDRSKQSITRRICSLPSSLFFRPDPHRQARIVEDRILHYDKASYKMVEKGGDNGWDTQGRKRCMGRGEKVMWTALFFLLGFHIIWDMERDKSRRANVTSPHFVYPPTRKITGKHTRQPRFYVVSHGRLPSLEGTHI